MTPVSGSNSRRLARSTKSKPLFSLFMGEDDDRAHFDHAKTLAAALDAQGLNYKWLTKDGEGHGFYKEENRQELWNELLGFLMTQEPRIR